jgi:hypothetical protein
MSCEQAVSAALTQLTQIETLIAAVTAACQSENDTAGEQMAADALASVKLAEKMLGDISADCAADAPMPMAVPSPDILASSVSPIASNFSVGQYIATGSKIPPSAAPDIVGAFRMAGNVARYSYDDPMVYPGQQGVSHLHEFVGNTAVDYTTTFNSLRTTGNGTTQGGPVNRSGYWAPALLLGNDIRVPDYWNIYYKRVPSTSSHLPVGASVAPLPTGLRMKSQNVTYKNATTGVSGSFDAVLASIQVGQQFCVTVEFPNLWDGQRIDCADHMAHMSVPVWDGNQGKFIAPAGYGSLIPTITLFRFYTRQAGEDFTIAEFSSDRMMNAAPGSTGHADYWEAWDRPTFTAIEANALEKLLNCSDGQIGDGRQLKRPSGFTFDQTPTRITLSDVTTTAPKVLIP